MSSTLTNLTAATTWSGTDLFYALVGGNSRKIEASSFLVGEATDVLSAVRSTNPQTFRVYRTFTDSSNYERLSLSSSGGIMEFNAETAGTGTDALSLKFTAASGGGYVIFQSGTGGAIQFKGTTTNTGAIEGFEHHYINTTGTAATGLGFGALYYIENASGSDVIAGRFDFAWNDATAASEDSLFKLSLCKNSVVTIMTQVDTPTTATQTALSIYDVDNNTLERVTVGIADSGGSGFKLLRIPN